MGTILKAAESVVVAGLNGDAGKIGFHVQLQVLSSLPWTGVTG